MAVTALLREKWSDLKLQTKLVFTFLITILTVIAVITTIITFSTKVFFVSYVHQHNSMRTLELKKYFEGFYVKNNHSWKGIQKILTEQPLLQSKAFSHGLSAIDRIILVGPDGFVIADSESDETKGKVPTQLNSQTSADLFEGQRAIGKVILGVNPPPSVATLEQKFFKSVIIATIAASVIAIILAIVLALQFSRRISVPLVTLTKATEKLAEKEFKYRLFIPAKDEIGILAQAFNAMADAIEKNETIRNHLVADVAHELRTPITIIRGTLESMQAGVLEPTPEVIISLHDELLRLSRLINDLQEISLAESGKLWLSSEKIDPVGIVDKVVNNFLGAASGKGIEISFIIPDLKAQIEVDYDRIIQVLSNILSNAIRHTPSGGKIEVSIKEDEKFIGFVFADSGPGINPEDLPFIFDRFYRGSKSRNRQDGGTGLGLAIARSLVELHAGKIKVFSPRDGGSIFTVYLPKA